MALSSWFKRGRGDAPSPDLRTQLVAAVMRKDLASLAGLVRDHHATIKTDFASWTTVPMAMKDDTGLLEKYGEMLMVVARLFEREGDGTLLKLLEGDPADAPVEEWNEQIAIAASLAEQGRHSDAVQVLAALDARLGSLRGSAVDFYRPRVLGKLGIARYRAGDEAGAITATRQARDICQQLGDEAGVEAYTASLENMAGS